MVQDFTHAVVTILSVSTLRAYWGAITKKSTHLYVVRHIRARFEIKAPDNTAEWLKHSSTRNTHSRVSLILIGTPTTILT